MAIKNLFAKPKKSYGKSYNEHLFEQYKLYVESAERISDRRQNANNYFLAINTAFISLLGFSFEVKGLEVVEGLRPILALTGIFICIIFWYLIRSYKQMNTGKFKVIHEIENHLPLSIYRCEWQALGEGKNKNLYYPFSHIESLVPWAFGIIYFMLGIVFLC